MGRKKLPPEKFRQKPLRIRLNPEERRLVDGAAEAEGHRSTSAWARGELLRLAVAGVRSKSSFQEQALRVLQELKAQAALTDQRRLIRQIERSSAYRQEEAQRSKTRDNQNIFGLINLAREAGKPADLDEAIWYSFLATHFGEYLLCDGEAISSAFQLLCAFGEFGWKPYWTWRRFHGNPVAFHEWLSKNVEKLASLEYGNHRNFQSKQPSGIWEVVESFLMMADDRGGPAKLLELDPPATDEHEAFRNLFERLRELRGFSVLGAFDFVVLLRDMKLVRAEPDSCYLTGRRKDRGPLGGAIKLWGNLPTAMLERLAAEVAKKLGISPVVLESALCDWNK
jgi:hypothetical protein